MNQRNYVTHRRGFTGPTMVALGIVCLGLVGGALLLHSTGTITLPFLAGDDTDVFFPLLSRRQASQSSLRPRLGCLTNVVRPARLVQQPQTLRKMPRAVNVVSLANQIRQRQQTRLHPRPHCIKRRRSCQHSSPNMRRGGHHLAACS